MAALDGLLTLSLAALAAGAIGVLTGLGFTAFNLGDASLWAIALAALSFLPATAAIHRYRRRARARGMADEYDQTFNQLLPGESDELAQAWHDAAQLAPAHTRELADARTACAALLQQHIAASESYDTALLDRATILERNVPALVSETQAVAQTASPKDRDITVLQMVNALGEVGTRARTALESNSADQRDHLSARRQHLLDRFE